MRLDVACWSVNFDHAATPAYRRVDQGLAVRLARGFEEALPRTSRADRHAAAGVLLNRRVTSFKDVLQHEATTLLAALHDQGADDPGEIYQ